MRLIYFLLPALAVVACNNHDTQKNVTRDTAGAHDTTFFAFVKADDVNPVLVPDSSTVFNCPILKKEVLWEAKDVFNPAVVIRNDTVFMLYRAEDKVGKYAGTSRIGLAWSADGLRFTKHPTPVFYPDNDTLKKWEWEGGCEDPRIVQDENGTYFMTYTAYDGDKARLLIASSPDLYHWKKYGHAFSKAYQGKYVNQWSKSGAIISAYMNGTPVATKINGKYWMYWGDTDIFFSSSEDLVNWTPVEDTTGKLLSIFSPRKGKFDSDLVESGPPAMLEKDAIRLIYNSRNVPSKGDTALAEGTYSAAYVLLDAHDPANVIFRSDHNFIKPDKPYEISGQVNQVCFLEGLVKLKGHWYLYYGTADSKIAVAVN
jgi:predicted GH43/DUF377 family glycosyl hydrolase